MSSVPLILGVVLAEHGGCESGTSSKLVDTSVRLVGGEFGTSTELVGTSVRLVGLRIWNERGARQNEWETRYWSHSEVADFPCLLVLTQKSKFVIRSFDPEPLALFCEPTQS